MRRRTLFGAIRNIAWLIGALALFISAGGSLFAAGEIGIHALRAEYRRPADIPYPQDDPYSHAKHVLGRTLFFDPDSVRLETSVVLDLP